MASQGVQCRPAVIVILELYENHEWRSGLAVNGLYLQDKASLQKAPVRSAKCADTACRPGDPLYDGEFHRFNVRASPQQFTDTRPLHLQVDIFCGL